MSDAAVQQPASPDAGPFPPLPEIAGRYRCLHELGRGGFGRVLMAEDDLLRRRVAVKLLQPTRRSGAAGFFADTAFLAEARTVAKLEHPGIVPIYDIVETDDGEYCIVSRYVEGSTLREQLTGRRFAFAESVDIAIGLSEALHHAHKHGIVHRDVKPANVMITTDGRPMLLDFGLARNWSETAGDGVAAGTPGYMSPEQARGEDHLVNSRSDIFSLGAIFYELLTGRRAFVAATVHEYLQLLTGDGPVPPRQVDSAIPKELERICLKALNPQIRSRYPVALDMANDLRSYLAAFADTIVAGPRRPLPAPSQLPVRSATQTVDLHVKQRVVPRGLRAFDEGDSDFFLSLIPGPRDRFGLPESLRFWKQRIESSDPDLAFRVGVLYGPSGCGKSSLVRAGLLPRCADHVTVLYHECRDTGNAARLGRALHAKFPQLDLSDSAPAALLQKIRQRGLIHAGSKLLIALDQGEQWLRAGENSASGEGPALLNTLRQCDGVRVQVLLLVRDDFWRGVTHLLSDADVELNNNNSALVDLFEPRHAEMVLESFGRAYRCLPEDPATPLPKGAREFIQQATRSLEQARRISPVKLALFADMFRTRDWTISSLRSVGGVGGVAVTFLEESFRGPTARGAQRMHEKAARQVLQLFVPEDGDVRGPARSQTAMVEASGYATGSKEFQELLHVLDGDLRLVTPVDSAESTDGQSMWQLTHDYMVPALRQWLLARKADTLSGRAEIALGERAREWHHRPDPTRLPSVWEWLRLRLLTKPFRWTPMEREWMHAGARRVQWWSALAILLAAAGWFSFREVMGAARGEDLARRVLAAPSGEVRSLLSQGASWRKWADPELRSASLMPVTSPEGLNARLALVPSQPAHVASLAGALLEMTSAQDFRVTCDTLADCKDVSVDRYREALADASATNGRKLRAYAALAAFAPEDPLMKTAATAAAGWLLTSESEPDAWAALLRPAAAGISPALVNALEPSKGPSERRKAAQSLASLHADDHAQLLRLLQIFPPEAVPLLTSALWRHPQSAAELQKVPPPEVMKQRNANVLPSAEEKTYAAHANVLLASACLGSEDQFWPALSRTADRTLRSMLMVHAASAGLSPEYLVVHLGKEKDPARRQAVLLMLSGYPMSALAASSQDRVVKWLRASYLSDPDGGVHSAIATLMKRWSLLDDLAALQKTLPKSPAPRPGVSWWVTPSGVDMRIVRMLDGRLVAIGSCEVTFEEFRRFEDEPKFWDKKFDPQAPIGGITWYQAARYCEWLSRLENIDAAESCYEEVGNGVHQRPFATERNGYRLPTYLEWQGATGYGAYRWDFGNAPSLAAHFAWIAINANGRARPVGSLLPNLVGVWDAHGNLREWSHEWVETASTSSGFTLGGAYDSLSTDFASVQRRNTFLSTMQAAVGFRLVRSLPTEKK